MIVDVLKKLVNKENLTANEINEVMNEVLNNIATEAQTGAFLTALRMKGETVDEITSCIKFLKENGEKLTSVDKDLIDIVGTGGDGSNTFNISTTSSFVAAAGGLNVAKHGNRAASSKSGAADILEKIGANICLNPKENLEVLNKTGFCFMFAPKFNPLLKNAAKVRKELKIRTVFNCLGPLINPSGAKTQLIGVYSKELLNPFIHVMKNLGVKNGMVLYGDGGFDEASITSKTYFAKLKDDKIEEGVFEPEDFDLERGKIEDIKGGTPEDNAKIMTGIFKGEIKGAKKDIVVLNAALAFYISNKTKSIKEGAQLASFLIESGAAHKKMREFIEATNEYLK